MRRHANPYLNVVFISLFCLLGSVSVFSDNAPQNIASYKIDVKLKLDEKGRPKDLMGRERLIWLNDSPDIINDLQFHLYLNAFKNEKSTFLRESGGQLRGDRIERGEWGWIDVNELKIDGGDDLTAKIEFIHPDDDNADDQSVIRVPLAKPINPGEKITLDIKFTAKLPRVFARTGYWGQFALVGQWFPKIGVWESVGERRRAVAGWNCHQFHANSEFYADFGNYDVTITVPAIYRGKIGATGKMEAETVNSDGTVSYNFSQTNVHDFAWTIDPNYLVVTRQFKADEQVNESEINEWARRLELNQDQIRLKDVAVTLLIQPEHRGQIDRHFAAAFNAIKYFGLWYGKYPYATLTIVDPPYNGGGAAGMEYPTFITAGTSWWPGRDQNPEEVVVHEFGHQFWQGMVASNEFEESWLDEGFNTYSTAKVLKQAYGANLIPVKLFTGIPLFYLPVEIRHPYEDRFFTLMG
ncbi:MAG: M1 family metallopeptidase, partial [Blastocatellia bacterium]|nr:M1 family metallopeptidase [Blastocatellia bacterium]